METKYTDRSFLRYLAIKGSKRISNWSKQTKRVECVVAITTEYAYNNAISRVVLVPAVDLDGNYMGSICLDDIATCRDANENEIKLFTDALAKYNLCMDNVDIHGDVHPLGKPAFHRVEKVTAVTFKDPSAVRFYYKGDLLTKEQAMAIELAEDESYLSRFDNGYSYESTAPISKGAFYETADILVNGTFKMECNGVWLTKTDKGEFAVKVLIGKNERWSQQSNT